MTYEKEILQILLEAGNDGLTVRKIARNVFNIHNGLFSAITYEAIHKSVSTFISRNCKSEYSLIESTGKRGYYRLNSKSDKTRQLMLEFHDEEVNELSPMPSEDKSLSLF